MSDEFKALGKTTDYPERVDASILEKFKSRNPNLVRWVRLNVPEYSSICPVTSQPDYGTLYISYIPHMYMVESKSLKLYLFGYRNVGMFHEECVAQIYQDLSDLLVPLYIEVYAEFLPRGGISIFPYVNGSVDDPFWNRFQEKRMLQHDQMIRRIDNL